MSEIWKPGSIAGFGSGGRCLAFLSPYSIHSYTYCYSANWLWVLVSQICLPPTLHCYYFGSSLSSSIHDWNLIWISSYVALRGFGYRGYWKNHLCLVIVQPLDMLSNFTPTLSSYTLICVIHTYVTLELLINFDAPMVIEAVFLVAIFIHHR